MSCFDTTVGDGVTETSLVADTSGENERGGYCFKSPRRPVTLLGWYPPGYTFSVSGRMCSFISFCVCTTPSKRDSPLA